MERIGRIINTHGIKGELKIDSSSDFINDRFKVGNTIILKVNKKNEHFEIASLRMHKGFVLISLKGLQDINLVEKYKGLDVYQELEEVDLAEDEYLYSDLIGLKIVDKEDKLLGEVVDVLPYPSQDILVCKTLKKEEKMIPFVKDIVLEVLEDKIIIENIEGLL